MIEFLHKLPAMNIEGRNNGTYNNTELALPGVLTTLDYRLGEFLHKLRVNIYAGRALLFIDGRYMMVNKNWIRDHVHVMKAMKHFEYELRNFLEFIIETQREDGQFYEMIKQLDDCHWKMVDDDCRIIYPEDNLALIRLELEADIEYLVVEGVMQYYRVTGDDDWLRRVFPKLEAGINYVTSARKRWNPELGLCIRPYTIDTWDFTNDKNSSYDRRIHENEPMCAMHGDNTGVWQAMKQLAWFCRRLGYDDRALEWEARAATLRENIFKHLWNGKFFVHQFCIGHDGIDNLESERMSLSLSYDINRGITDIEQSRSIIAEYIKRRKTTDNFAEWFTVDPPYEIFNSHKKGEYVNGAISPFTAGELAKAAFNSGYERYGWDIISRFIELVERDGDVYFLYYPDSRPQPEGGPSAWGAAALISAVDEGLAGVEDIDVCYRRIRFSPRFPVTPYTELRYFTGYELSAKIVDIRYILTNEGMRYDIISPAYEINAHILLPDGKSSKRLLVNGEEMQFKLTKVAESVYVDFEVKADRRVNIEIYF
jgi:hypothetical protein